MSEGGDLEKSSASSGESEREGLCRDYLRGVCDRQRCKYKHEKQGGGVNQQENVVPTLNFCHDFQNNSCPRPHCRFIHCTALEEEQYKRTGELPVHIQADAARKHQWALGSIPVCKNFLNGECRRMNACKYRHLTRAEHEGEIIRALKMMQPNEQDFYDPHTVGRLNENTVVLRNPLNVGIIRRNGSSYNSFGDFGPPETKRRFLAQNNMDYVETNGFDISDHDLEGRSLQVKGYFAAAGQQGNPLLARLDPRTIMLEEENSMLRKQMMELKKQVSDLTATNEFLLDQNAQLRVASKRNATNVTSVTVPAVTITNTTVPPNNTPAQPPQQVIRTVTASVATVPVSIATVTAGNPVSIGGVSMAPVQAVPAVSMAQPPAQQIIAQSQQLLDPTSQLTLANSSQAQLAIAQQSLANNLAQQTQPLSSQQLTSQAQQLALANTPQQLTLASTSQLTSQAQLALASTSQLTSQAQLALASTSQQLLAQQNLASSQQMALTGNTPMSAAIDTSQAIAMSNATQPMVSYPIMTQSVLQNALPH